MFTSLYYHVLSLLFPKTDEEARIELILARKISLPRALERAPYPQLLYYFSYRHADVKALIWHLKYKGDQRIARFFAELLYDELVEELSERAVFDSVEKPILVPIALSWQRRAWRGYNQAERLGQSLQALDKGKTFSYRSDILYRIKNNSSQAKTKNKSSRQQNMIGSFEVRNASTIKNKTIILIDDVVTTGSTMQEANKVLLQAGARKILWLAVAH